MEISLYVTMREKLNLTLIKIYIYLNLSLNVDFTAVKLWLILTTEVRITVKYTLSHAKFISHEAKNIFMYLTDLFKSCLDENINDLHMWFNETCLVKSFIKLHNTVILIFKLLLQCHIPLTSLTSMPLLTDHVVWKHSMRRCSRALGRRCTRMKSFRSLVLVWYWDHREYILWMMAVTFPNTRACISADNRRGAVFSISCDTHRVTPVHIPQYHPNTLRRETKSSFNCPQGS